MRSNLVVAIDGPAGAGKSTVAKRVAASLGCIYVDTGAMYRALTLRALRSDVSLSDGDALLELMVDCDLQLIIKDGVQRVILDGNDVSDDIRTPEVTSGVSVVSAHPEVRNEMVRRQRDMVSSMGAVMDGRDIGTVVLPSADYKFYIDAPAEVRAKRRWLEMAGKGVDVPFEEVLRDQIARDAYDSSREVAPLKPADDAIIIDSGDKTIDEVVIAILDHCQRG